MRLLNVKTYGFEDFLGDAIEPYGIFSHTWMTPSKDEVTHGDMLRPEVAAGKPGFSFGRSSIAVARLRKTA
ncbi:hypothetical protein PG989_001445 [Apiospora arundinis]